MYEFTEDWFSRLSDHWLTHVVPRLPRPFAWLEIGSHEGRSACWLLDNVAQPGDAIHCVDAWVPFDGIDEPNAERRFDTNTAGRVIKHKKLSHDFFVAALPSGAQFDGIYIDGDHEARQVIEDLVFAWRLLKFGGVMVMDDYEWPERESHAGKLPPRPAIDAFLHLYQSRINVLHCGYQVIVEKVRE